MTTIKADDSTIPIYDNFFVVVYKSVNGWNVIVRSKIHRKIHYYSNGTEITTVYSQHTIGFLN